MTWHAPTHRDIWWQNNGGNAPTYVYRAWDTEGRLLYVGVARDPIARESQHRREKPWWHQVADVQWTRYPSRPEALAAERQAIAAEQPTMNIAYPGHLRRP